MSQLCLYLKLSHFSSKINITLHYITIPLRLELQYSFHITKNMDL